MTATCREVQPGSHGHGAGRDAHATQHGTVSFELPTAVLPHESWTARGLTWLGRAIDGTMVEAMRLVVDRALLPPAERVRHMRAAAEPYVTEELVADPARFFSFPEETLVPLRVTTRRRRRLIGGAVERHRLTAVLAPWAGRGGALHDDIRLEHWAHEARRPRAVVLAMHGFAMGTPVMDAVALFAATWYRRGLDVALMTLPHHGRRAAPDARFSGERFASPDPGELNEAVRRAVYEIRLAMRWLGARTRAPVGLLGLSLGGYLASLTAGLTDEPAFVVPMVPPVCFGDLAWRFFERRGGNRGAAAPAMTRDDFRRMFRVHSPLSHPLRVPRQRVLIVAGRGDRIVPPEHPHALWRHWGEPRIHWFSGGHVTPFARGGITRAIGRHLDRLGLG
jgi:hypothetical protein